MNILYRMILPLRGAALVVTNHVVVSLGINVHLLSDFFVQGGRGMHDALSYCNQYGTGAAVKDFLAQRTDVSRKDIFMMSMVPYHLLGYNNTLQAVEASLSQLQVTYIDLVMLHHRAADISEWPRSLCQMKAFPNGG